MKADGSNVVQLTSHAGQNIALEYSPDGATIVFDKEGSPGVEGIYIMNASDGAHMRRVTVAPAGYMISSRTSRRMAIGSYSAAAVP
jgi:Tol biopolymer transport system component